MPGSNGRVRHLRDHLPGAGSCTGSLPVHRPATRATSPSRPRSAGTTSSTCPPTFAFSSSGRAGRDHPAVIDHDDVVGKLVGLVQVLSRQQHRYAVGDQHP